MCFWYDKKIETKKIIVNYFSESFSFFFQVKQSLSKSKFLTLTLVCYKNLEITMFSAPFVFLDFFRCILIEKKTRQVKKYIFIF